MNRLRRKRLLAISLWLAFVVLCAWLVSRASFTADLSAFLPKTPTQEQQLLVDQLKSGIASRLILIGIEGGDEPARVAASKAVASILRSNVQFLHIANGESIGLDRDREILFENRYLLSPTVDAKQFSVEGLNAAVADSIDQLASSTGLFTKALLPRDPTGEFLRILDQMGGENQARLLEGVWASRDGQRVLLLARTRAEGSDTDGQERAMKAIRSAFDQHATPGLKLVMTGPGPFSVQARATIKGEVAKLSGLSALIIVSLLLVVYRSPTTLVIGLLPVLSGALAGVAAVSLGFGTVHGITLGFGTALIGEAVDYSIYLFMQSEGTGGRDDQSPKQRNDRWLAAFWPTIRIGVLTSVFGFATLLFSGFPGLAQLGLYSIAGLVTAATVTRFVLPHLMPNRLSIRDASAFGQRLQTFLPTLSRWKWPLFGLVITAIVVLANHRDSMWNKELAALSPVSAADQQLDMTLRADLGAPDVRYLVVVTATDAQTALAGSEKAGQVLDALVETGIINGFGSPATYLPSLQSQQQRQASLPDDQTLHQRFTAAITGLPLRLETFAPFFTDVAKARESRLLQRGDIEGSSLAQGVDALLVKAEGRWTALMPLRAPHSTAPDPVNADVVRAALAKTGLAGVYFVDMKSESNRLYSSYLREAIQLSLLGLAAIIVLLLVATRAVSQVLRIIAPLLMAVIVVTAGLALLGQQLTILHLVGMLLVVAVGSNYALFFNRHPDEAPIAPRTLASLALATTTTVAGFGLLAFSSVPVLNAIGSTVGPGAILALLFSAILAQR